MEVEEVVVGGVRFCGLISRGIEGVFFIRRVRLDFGG